MTEFVNVQPRALAACTVLVAVLRELGLAERMRGAIAIHDEVVPVDGSGRPAGRGFRLVEQTGHCWPPTP